MLPSASVVSVSSPAAVSLPVLMPPCILSGLLFRTSLLMPSPEASSGPGRRALSLMALMFKGVSFIFLTDYLADPGWTGDWDFFYYYDDIP